MKEQLFVQKYQVGSVQDVKKYQKNNGIMQGAKMGAYICDVCDNMFCSHEVNYMYCEKCKTAFCEGCWQERLDEEQELTEYDICGDCFRKAALAAAGEK